MIAWVALLVLVHAAHSAPFDALMNSDSFTLPPSLKSFFMATVHNQNRSAFNAADFMQQLRNNNPWGIPGSQLRLVQLCGVSPAAIANAGPLLPALTCNSNYATETGPSVLVVIETPGGFNASIENWTATYLQPLFGPPDKGIVAEALSSGTTTAAAGAVVFVLLVIVVVIGVCILRSRMPNEPSEGSSGRQGAAAVATVGSQSSKKRQLPDIRRSRDAQVAYAVVPRPGDAAPSREDIEMVPVAPQEPRPSARADISGNVAVQPAQTTVSLQEPPQPRVNANGTVPQQPPSASILVQQPSTSLFDVGPVEIPSSGGATSGTQQASPAGQSAVASLDLFGY